MKTAVKCSILSNKGVWVLLLCFKTNAYCCYFFYLSFFFFFYCWVELKKTNTSQKTEKVSNKSVTQNSKTIIIKISWRVHCVCIAFYKNTSNIWPVQQPYGLVNSHSSAPFFRLPIPLVPCVHVLLWEVAAKEIKVGRVHSDQSWVQHVLHLQECWQRRYL